MMLGTDVSSLSTTAATAAAQGLSIVVPLYNEAAGLAHLHERLDDLARTLRQRYRLAGEGGYGGDGPHDVTPAPPRGLAAHALEAPGGSPARHFRQQDARGAGFGQTRPGA